MKLWLLALTPLLSLGQSEPLPRADGYHGLWYSVGPTHDEYRWKYSGGMATYPQQHAPIAVYRKDADKTFFVYGGTNDPSNRKPQLLHMVSYFDHSTGTVPRPAVLLNKKTDDAHDNATLSFDVEGRLLVFCNAHGLARPSYVYRSVRPLSIDAFERIYEGNFSYGQPWSVPGEGILLLHTHYEKSDGLNNVHALYWMTSPDGKTWSERRPLARIPKGQYQISWTDPRDPRRIATVFDFHPEGLDTRTNLYYLETSDLGRTWKTVEGKVVETPLTEPKNPALIHDYHGEKLNVYLKDLQFDADGRPVILYLTSKGAKPGPSNAPYQWHTCRWTGTSWEMRGFTTSDHNYDHGSIYLDAQGGWTVLAPTDPGPQPFGAGGEIVSWKSGDQGKTWTRAGQLTRGSARNQSYLRRPLNAHDGFWAIWSDGDARNASESSIYFTDRKAGRVWRLPAEMKEETAKPEALP